MDAGQIASLLTQLKDGALGNQEMLLLLSGLNRNVGELNGILESLNLAYRNLQPRPKSSASK